MNPFPTVAGPQITRLPRVGTAAAILVVACGLLGSCATPATDAGRGSASGPARTHVIEVVAAEDVWGSIAAQIGGEHVHVVSIITNPNTDPHGYETASGPARTHVIEVVAAEDVWGSIAAQIGGEHVHVVSIITNPNTDPHGYE